MKKLYAGLFIFCILLLCGINSQAATFSEVIGQSKPSAVLIYADWADNVQNVTKAFKAAEQKYGSKYNFATLNIADPETKAFNQTYHIYPNLPYVLLFRDRGRISRLVKRDCITTSSCLNDKLELFVN